VIVSRTARLFIITVLLTVTFIFISSAAHAKKRINKIATRKVGANIYKGTIKTTFGFSDIFNNKIIKKIKSGLPTRIVLQIIIKNSNNKTVGYFAQTTSVVYDLWEDNYVITIKHPAGMRSARVKNLKSVKKIIGVLSHTVISSKLPKGRYRLNVQIEANPVSEKMIKNIQKWMSKPSGSMSGTNTTTNYFGSFVGYFVDRNIGKADKTILFVSQWIKL